MNALMPHLLPLRPRLFFCASRMLEVHLARLSVAAEHLFSLGFPKV